MTTDPVSGIWSTTVNAKGTRTIISSHTHMKPHTEVDNQQNQEITLKTGDILNLAHFFIFIHQNASI